jgi:hypothetical protein
MGYAAAGGSKGGEEITSRSISFWHKADNLTAPALSGGKADITIALRNVRFRPKADIRLVNRLRNFCVQSRDAVRSSVLI